MKLAITVARVGKKWTVLQEPSHDVLGHKALFKKIRIAGGDHEKTRYEEVQVLGSGNLHKHARFATKSEQETAAKRVAEDNKAFNDAREAENKAATAKPSEPTQPKKHEHKEGKKSK